MISLGTNITSATEVLQRIDLRQLYELVAHPDVQLASFVRQLRIVRSVDSKQYSLLKRRLPYAVCGIFNPSQRRTDCFAYTEYFCLDIDHMADKQMDVENLRRKLEADSRVALSFVSPGMDGLKLFFRLSERCYDPGVYSLFYKEFARRFSLQYGLEQVVDTRTCDVSRACFLSADEFAMLREDSESVDIHAVLPSDNPQQLFDIKHEHDVEMRKAGEERPQHDPDGDALAKIRKLLNPKVAKVEACRPPAFVPSILDDMIDGLKAYIEKMGVEVYEIGNIQYTKKIRCRLGLRQAEVNLFYGHKGFRVVKSPRGGTSDELNELVAQMIEVYLQEN